MDTKKLLMIVGLVLLGVIAAPKIRSLPMLDKLPSL